MSDSSLSEYGRGKYDYFEKMNLQVDRPKFETEIVTANSCLT